MNTPEVTIIMVPRERYSGIVESIESLYANTPSDMFELVVIDGALPDSIRRWLENAAKERGFRFIHEAFPPTPNEARNRALEHVTTPYILFADNDVLYTPGWLPTLVNTAKEFDAWLVGPLILDGAPEDGFIHAAGGEKWFDEIDGERRYHFVPGHLHKKVPDVKEELKRGPVTMLEFHVLLARADSFDTIGPLDEDIYSFGDHEDLVNRVLAAGGSAVFEPASVVAYHDPGTNIHVLESNDLSMFLLRWSDAWAEKSVDRYAEKTGIAPNDPWIAHAKAWVRVRRQRVYPVAGLVGRALSFAIFHLSPRAAAPFERWFCARHTKALDKLRQRA